MLLKIGVILAAIPTFLLALVAGTGIVVVDVRPSDGPHLIVPVPLLLAETVVRLAPGAGSHLPVEHQLDKAREYLPAAVAVLDALSESPDGDLVEVDDQEQHVRISKVGDVLQVRVNGPGEEVSVNVPLALAREAVRQAGQGRISPGDLIGALQSARMTKLVEVKDGDNRVKITVW